MNRSKFPMSIALKPICLVDVFALFLSTNSFGNSRSEQEPLQVVTSFSVLADWAKEIGGNQVEVSSLVGLDEDVHVFSASPRDLARVAKADVLIVNGLRLEGWISRLVSSSGFGGRLIVASDGVSVIRALSLSSARSSKSSRPDDGGAHSHNSSRNSKPKSTHGHFGDDDEIHANQAHAHQGNTDPHAWLSLRMATIYVDNIEQALSALRPEQKTVFAQNAERYKEQLSTLDRNLTEAFRGVPAQQRSIVVPHNAFAYFARDYDLRVHSLQGLDSAAETSAATFARVVRTLRQMKVKAVFGENISNNRLIKRVADEAGIELGGFLFSGALSDDGAQSYLKMMEYNSKMITEALASP